MLPRKFVLFGLMICLAVAPQIAAQSRNIDGSGAMNAHSDEAIPIGPFLFSPTVQLTWQHRDNIFFTPDNEVADNVLLARARLLFELPIYESYIRFSYAPQYRDYKNYDYREKWGHYFDIGGEFEFSSGLEMAANYQFIQSAMEVREVDAGGELMPGEDLFDKHFFEIRADYWFSERDALSLEGAFDRIDFDQTEDTFFYDYSRDRLGIAWLHQINPVLRLDVRYRRTEFDSEDTLPYRDSTSDEVTVGLDGQLSDVIRVGMSVGWRNTSYDYSGPDSDFTDFSSFIMQGDITWDMAHGSSLRLNLLRSDYPSNYATNAYYTATGASLIYDLIYGRIEGQLRVRFQNNDYELIDPWFGEYRSDDILTFGLGLGFRFTELLSLRGGVLIESREDGLTERPYSYDTTILFLGLVVGY